MYGAINRKFGARKTVFRLVWHAENRQNSAVYSPRRFTQSLRRCMAAIVSSYSGNILPQSSTVGRTLRISAVAVRSHHALRCNSIPRRVDSSPNFRLVTLWWRSTAEFQGAVCGIGDGHRTGRACRRPRQRLMFVVNVYMSSILCVQVPPSFSTLIFHDFSMTKKRKSMTSAQHIFPSKRHTTYECIPELVVTVPVRIGP